MTEIRDYELYCGTDYTIRIRLEEDGAPADLTDFRGRMQLRRTLASCCAFELSTDDEAKRIEITPAEGKVELLFRSKETKDLPAGKYLFDLELYAPDDTVARILSGTIAFLPEVTRDECH